MYEANRPGPFFLIRRRIARIFENIFAMAVGAVVVALAQGMSPSEIAELAMNNAHKLPELLNGMVTQAFGADFGALFG